MEYENGARPVVRIKKAESQGVTAPDSAGDWRTVCTFSARGKGPKEGRFTAAERPSFAKKLFVLQRIQDLRHLRVLAGDDDQNVFLGIGILKNKGVAFRRPFEREFIAAVAGNGI